MNVLMKLVIFALEIIKYQTAYYLCFSKKLKRYWIACVVGILSSFVFGLYPNIAGDGGDVLLYICAFASILFMMQGTWKQYIINFLEMFFLVCCLDEINGILVKITVLHIVGEYDIRNIYSVINALLTVIMLEISVWIKENRTLFSEKIWSWITAKLYYFVIMMAIEIQIIIAALDYAEEYVSNFKFTTITMVLCTLSYVSVGVLGIFVIYIRRTNRKMKEMLQREILAKDMQQYYYEALLEKEEDTRRYRHDMANHLLCLNHLAQCQDMDGLTEYLQKMQTQTSQIQRKCYVTGNQMLDVITNYHLGMLKQEADVRVSGQVVEKLVIDSMALCTIYANLLQNAVEELEKEGENKFLKVKFLQGKEYLQITIQNSLSKESMKKKELLHSEKTDEKNHGIGLRNVRETVEECKGKLELIQGENSFTAQVVLPNK